MDTAAFLLHSFQLIFIIILSHRTRKSHTVSRHNSVLVIFYPVTVFCR